MKKKQYIIEYCVMREGVPFSLKSIRRHNNRRKRRIIIFNL